MRTRVSSRIRAQLPAAATVALSLTAGSSRADSPTAAGAEAEVVGDPRGARFSSALRSIGVRR